MRKEFLCIRFVALFADLYIGTAALDKLMVWDTATDTVVPANFFFWIFRSLLFGSQGGDTTTIPEKREKYFMKVELENTSNTHSYRYTLRSRQNIPTSNPRSTGTTYRSPRQGHYSLLSFTETSRLGPPTACYYLTLASLCVHMRQGPIRTKAGSNSLTELWTLLTDMAERIWATMTQTPQLKSWVLAEVLCSWRGAHGRRNVSLDWIRHVFNTASPVVDTALLTLHPHEKRRSTSF